MSLGFFEPSAGGSCVMHARQRQRGPEGGGQVGEFVAARQTGKQADQGNEAKMIFHGGKGIILRHKSSCLIWVTIKRREDDTDVTVGERVRTAPRLLRVRRYYAKGLLI